MSAENKSRVLSHVKIVSLMTAVSRVFGLLREVAMGYLFGTSPLKSAFDLAFLVPNLFRRLFGEGALSSAFIPVFAETHENCHDDPSRKQAWRLASRVLVMLSVFLAIVTLAGILLTYPLAKWLPPGSRWLLPLPMMRIMLPYALLICVAAIISGILNFFNQYFISSLTPFLLNLMWIAALVGLIVAPNLFQGAEAQLHALCFAILAAGVAQILFQLPKLHSVGFRLNMDMRGLFKDERLMTVLKNTAPAALGMGLIQINVCCDKLLAYWADKSAPAALEYAERITYLPLGMFATAFMTVLLPTFSKYAAAGAFDDIRDDIEKSIRNLMIVMAPCSLALVFLAAPVIQAIYAFKGGNFDETSVTLCARALAAYAPGLMIFSIQKIFTPAFYGVQDMKTPVKIGVFGLFLNITLNVSSVIMLPEGWKHCGIAGSTVVTSFVNGIAYYKLLPKCIPTPRLSRMVPSALKSIAAAAVMAGVALLFWNFGHKLLGEAFNNKLAELALMGVTVLFAMVLYTAGTLLINRREFLDMIKELLNRKRGKRNGNKA